MSFKFPRRPRMICSLIHLQQALNLLLHTHIPKLPLLSSLASLLLKKNQKGKLFISVSDHTSWLPYLAQLCCTKVSLFFVFAEETSSWSLLQARVPQPPSNSPPLLYSTRISHFWGHPAELLLILPLSPCRWAEESFPAPESKLSVPAAHGACHASSEQ